MKTKLFPLALLALVSGVVSGCPVYDDEDGCVDDYDCSVGYYCDGASGACIREGASAGCKQPSDCASTETCSKSGICAAGDCHFASVGCVSGFECSSDSGRWECVREGSTGGKGSSGGASGSGGAEDGAAGSGGAEDGAAGSGGEGG